MKRVIKLIAFTLIISFLIDKIVYFSLNKLSDKVYTGQSVGKLNEYLSIKDTVDIMVYGSSRAHHHIDINKLSKNGYNMGVNGRFIIYATTLMKLLPKEKEQLIILHIDPERAVVDDYNGEDIKALAVKYHRSKVIKNEIDELKQNNLLQKFYWCIDYNGKTLGILENYINSDKKENDFRGFEPLHVTEYERQVFRKLIDTYEFSPCVKERTINSYYIEYLKKITEINKGNKKVVVITSPMYIDNCDKDNVLLKNLLSELDVQYFDFTHLFSEDNRIEYWRDKTHLSNIGAEMFTDTLINVLRTHEVLN